MSDIGFLSMRILLVEDEQKTGDYNYVVLVFDDLTYKVFSPHDIAQLEITHQLTVLPGEFHGDAPPRIYVHNYLKSLGGRSLPFAFLETPVLTDIYLNESIEYMLYAIYEPVPADALIASDLSV